ncbi:hypothetical protein A3E49_03730 [Candidatus Saccharibacteria bacterium RIFCSPHIGHO2_12_FULL_49_19]|nr:MAG: hypothetical protein A3E49_03730 [Candidatus Saccharibacteria bacterium RIFCSPHIGHO2_12_FULL_49_19]OGL37351.1 MAG: hypothetical protein A3B63_02255 [Candidatus Saccharibacteria bacterium RIFCSPLOWO2_01_FULL_49_22]
MRRFLRRGDVRLGLLIILLVTIAVVIYARSDGLEFSPQLTNGISPGFYKVEEFIDGDTISVNMDGRTEIIRMIGVDTPETHRPDTPVQCYGVAAADYTKRLIGDHSVRLEADPLNTNRDRYERLLRYIYLPDGTLVESKLIAEGYGFAYTSFPMVKAIEFKALEETAKQGGKGLWSACQVTTLPNGIRQTNSAN